jgi:uncharacterized membrane protein
MNHQKRTQLLIALIVCNLFTNIVYAQTRDIDIYTPFPKIEFTTGQRIMFKVTIENKGTQPETLSLIANGPKDWNIEIKSDLYKIKSVYVGLNESKTIDVTVGSLTEQPSGNYSIFLTAESSDSLVKETVELQVELPIEVSESGLSLIASYPSLEGSIGEDFEFRMNTINKANKDSIIFFTAVHPENWEVSFKPRFGSSVVRSLEFAAGASDVVIIDISPPLTVQPGQYDIIVNAETEEVQESMTFTVYIMGSYSLEAKPSNNRLSLEAIQGEPNIVSLNITNSGSALLENILLFSDKPPGWDIDFEFEDIPSLERGASRQVRVNIVPPVDAIPGDYAVTLYSSIQARGISNTLNYRVTVTGAVGWGYIGIGIIGLLAVVLGAIIYRLGRR